MSAPGPGRAGKPTFSYPCGGPLPLIDFTFLLSSFLPDLLPRLGLVLDILVLDLGLELFLLKLELEAAPCGIVELVLDLDLGDELLLLCLELF